MVVVQNEGSDVQKQEKEEKTNFFHERAFFCRFVKKLGGYPTTPKKINARHSEAGARCRFVLALKWLACPN